MEIQEEYYNKIINFMDGNMTIAEMEAFEIELKANQNLQEQLDFEHKIRDAFILQTLKKEKKKTYTYLKYAAAAAILIFLFLEINYLQNNKKPANDIIVKTNIEDTIVKNTLDTQKKENNIVQTQSIIKSIEPLFAQYYKKDTSPENYPMYLAEAFEGYKNDNYTELLKIDENNLPQTRSANENEIEIKFMVQYYKAIIMLQTNKIEKANILFEKLLLNKTKFDEDAKWYAALCYIKLNNKEKALVYLNNLLSTKKYANSVKNLIADIKK